MEGLKRYAAYKESGLPWLGRVPAHWEASPGFAAFREKQIKNVGMQEKRVLSLSYGRIVVKPEGQRGLMPDSFETYQIVDPGDIIIRSTDLQNDKTSLRIGFVRDRGIITSAYICMKATDAVLPEFGYQLLNAYDLSKVLYGMGSGLRQNLEWADFKRMPVFLPSREEQTAIVRFLDHATHQLDKTIRAKRKIIALLNEQKQAIIHCAVTRGLDPGVPLKDSGIPWLGQIPAHWELRKIKRFFRTCSGGTPNSGEVALYYNGPIPWIRTMDLNNDLVTDYVEGITNQAILDTACKVLPIGSVLVAMYGGAGTIGKNGLLEIEATTNQALCALLPSPRFDPKFVLFFMQYQRPYWMIGADGTRKDPNISQERIRETEILLPPLVEQGEIVRYIENETSGLHKFVVRLEHEIFLLREYRTRLIADVVTGKLDVRAAAARLPEIAPEATEELDNSELDETVEDLAEADA